MTVRLYEGDSYQVLRDMAERGEMVDSCVCDPPYGLVSVVKRFGKEGSAPAKHGKDGAFSRASKGFMGKRWDGSAIERDPEFWKLVFAVMKPGAYIVAFSSSRTYHHMAVALEAAGFITHPMIAWTYASGMPKAHNAARAVDLALGVKGTKEATGEPVRRIRPGAEQIGDGSWEKLEDREYQPGKYVPGSEEAAQWDGWHYGGQVRKPAMEPIYVGQKPFSEKNGALNILKHGVGAVNVDGCRVPAESRTYSLKGGENLNRLSRPGGNDAGDAKGLGAYGVGAKQISIGEVQAEDRWPANLIHDGSDEVLALFPDSKGAAAPVRGSEPSSKTGSIYGEFGERAPSDQRDAGGSAARFFECYPFDGQPLFHVAKAKGSDRITRCTACGTRFTGRPTCDCKGADGRRAAVETHPTVKPPKLIQALVRHVTPPGGVVLDPFAGSGTTGAAALAEGMRAVLIELEATYAADIRHRLGIAPPITDPDILDLLGEEACRYCGNTGWFYSMPELGPCTCDIPSMGTLSTSSLISTHDLLG